MPSSFRVVVIGGVAAGPKIAAKVARLRPEAEVTLIEKGEHLSYAGCGLTYYISDMVREQKDLMSTPVGIVRDAAFFQNVKNVRVLNRTEAVEIDRANKRVRLRSPANGAESWIAYDKLALATGARRAVPPLPGANLRNVFGLKDIADAEAIKQATADADIENLVIIGGGLIGVEAAEAFVAIGCNVTIVEMLPQILAPLDWEMACHVQKHMTDKGVRILTGAPVASLEGAEKVEAVVLASGERIPADAVLIAVGIKPEARLAAQAGLEIGPTGAIRTDEYLCTSDPDIYAAGDCAESRHLITGRPCWAPRGSTANKQGRVAAINLCGGSERFPGVLDSMICKVFDYAVGLTGLTERAARECGYEAVAALVPAPDRADYYAGKKMLMLKMVADRATGRLLGLQAIGPGEAAKRLDVAATAITAGMTVDQVSKLDLCYAPPYSPAMDNLITAANVVKNKIEGRLTGISPVELKRRLDAGEPLTLLDVRTPAEFEKSRLAGAIHIPLGALRKRHGELPRDKDLVVYCGSALRAYEAALILHHAGFDRVRVLDGSVLMWPYELEKPGA